MRPLVLTVLLASLAWVSPVHAQTRSPQVEQLIEEGLAHREQGRDATAIASFEHALRLEPRSGEVKGQLALAELSAARRNPATGAAHFLRALTLLDETLADRIDDWVRRHRRTLERELRQLRESLGTLVIPVGPGSVRIIAPGLDERRPLPLGLELSPGQYTLSIQAEGQRLIVKEVSVARGEVTRIAESEFVRAEPAHLPEAPAPAPAPALVSEPDALPDPPNVDLRPVNDFDATGLAELPAGFVVAFDSDVYRRRRNRFFGFASLFAASAGTFGFLTWLSRPSASVYGSDTRSDFNVGMLSTTIGSLVLFIAAGWAGLIVHGKWRRSLVDPNPLAINF